jgi:hypothetical protein
MIIAGIEHVFVAIKCLFARLWYETPSGAAEIPSLESAGTD